METNPEPTPSDTPKTNITVLARIGENEVPIGAIQSLSITETKNINAQGESASVSGVASRIRFDRLRLGDTFSSHFLHAKSQRYPIHFRIEMSDGSKITIHNIWITDMSDVYMVTEWVIMDEMRWQAEKIELMP